jgi:hypothetical protein
MAGTEIYGHVQGIPEQASESLHRFYMSQHVEPTSVAITQRILHAFVELYFEYFNPQFPFLHPSRLEDPELPWILLLATAAVGSQYSEIQGAEQYSMALCDLLARAVESTVSCPAWPSPLVCVGIADGPISTLRSGGCREHSNSTECLFASYPVDVLRFASRQNHITAQEKHPRHSLLGITWQSRQAHELNASRARP